MNTQINAATLERDAAEYRREAREILDRAGDGDLTGADAARFDELAGLIEQTNTAIAERNERLAEIRSGVASGQFRLEGEGSGVAAHMRPDADRDPALAVRDTAMRSIDAAVSGGRLAARGAELVEGLMSTGPVPAQRWTQRWAAAAGAPAYERAFAKLVGNPTHGHLTWTPEESDAYRRVAEVLTEQRAMSLTDNAGGYMVPLTLDPAVNLTSAGSVNPLRQIARVVQTSTESWNGITSAGVTAEWLAEASEAADASPTLDQPSIPVHKGSAFVPFSFEIEGDAVNFMAELGKLLVDSAEQLSAAAFTTGSGNGQPTGFITALAAASPSVIVDGDGSEVLADGDPVKLQNSLPPRFQPNSRFVAALPTLNWLRFAETTNGSLLYPSLQSNPPTLLGRPVHEVSNMDGAINNAVTESNYVLAVGDWSQFLIVDRVGSTIELVPHLVGANRRPTGQRGALLWFRTGSDVVNSNAFRLLDVPTGS